MVLFVPVELYWPGLMWMRVLTSSFEGGLRSSTMIAYEANVCE